MSRQYREYEIKNFLYKKIEEGYTVKKIADNLYKFTIRKVSNEDINLKKFFNEVDLFYLQPNQKSY